MKRQTRRHLDDHVQNETREKEKVAEDSDVALSRIFFSECITFYVNGTTSADTASGVLSDQLKAET